MVDSQPTNDMGRVFVGRQQEMAQLKATLDDVLAGHGRLVMLVGEPGIGKTRTAQELAALAETSGAQVLWGWCYEDEGAPPYWPWIDPIRSYVRESASDRLETEMGPGAADIAGLLPEVYEKLPGLRSVPSLDPEQARFSLFDSLSTFLKNAAQRQPLMLILDDLHWADRSSLLLLEFMSRTIAESPILLIGTYRDVEVTRNHPLSQTLGVLVREQHFRRVQLGGLSQRQVGEFVEGGTGLALRHATVEAIHRRTEGNPLFVGEVVSLLTTEEIDEEYDWANTIPGGVRDAIRRRLSRLSQQCNDVLTTASVIGREFDFRLLQFLNSDLKEYTLLEVVDEALAAGLIEEAPGKRERYQFHHALIQETLSQELSISRRVRLHARIGEALEEIYGADLEAHGAELAHHFAEAAPVIGPEKLVHYSLLAGEQALAAYAHEEALGHFERGLTAKGIPLSGTEPPADGETAALLFGLGRGRLTRVISSEVAREAVGNLTRAFDYFAAAGDVAHAVAIAEYPLPTGAGVVDAAGQFVAQALKLVPPDSYEAGRLLARSAWDLGRTGADYGSASETFDRALAIARREGDLVLEMDTLAAAAEVDLFHLRVKECCDKAQQALNLAQRVDNPRAEAQAHQRAVLALTISGDPDGALGHASAGLALAERLRQNFWITTTVWGNQIVSQLVGDWETAREFSARGLAVNPDDLRNLGSRSILEHEVGSYEQGEVYLQPFLRTADRLSLNPSTISGIRCLVIPVVARATGRDEGLAAARAASESLLSMPSTPPLLTTMARTGLALLAVMEDDVSAAREQYAGLESQRSTMVPNCAACSIDRILGLLAQTMGDLERAFEHFDEALAFCKKAGYRPELAWICCDYADALVACAEQNRALTPEVHQKVRALLQESLAISTELGMVPLMQRVQDRLERAESLSPGSASRSAATYPDGLSQREVEVLRLIATGKTNREIADELIISVKTVGYHVGNILNKTTSTNRAEAATYASQNGLV